MAKKTRTPPPPRRVQAPKVRTGREGASDRQRMLLYLLAGSGIVALAVVLGAIFLLGGNGDGGAGAIEKLRAAGCTFQTVPARNRDHVPPTERVNYNTFPPTNGPHDGQPAIWNVYDDPISQRQAVHNLEHGGVVMQYGGRVPAAEVEELVAFYREDPNGLLVAPFPRLGNRISLQAWTAPEQELGEGRLALCTRFDEDVFQAFIDEFGFRGPEPFPRELLQPGT